jgi:hypothetical protein
MRRTIVRGEFATEPQAARAVDKLLRACIGGEHVRAFFLNRNDEPRRMPPRRIETALAPRTAMRRSSVIALDLGPAAAADGVEISVYACTGAPAQQTESEEGPARILIAVETPDRVSQVLAMNVLRQYGAEDIERMHAPRTARAGLHPVSLSMLLERSHAGTGHPPGITRH